MTDEELAEIVEEYRYGDRSHMGEVLNALATEKVLRKKAEANYAFMVAKAADQSLDGYRELGQRCAQLEAELEAAEARLAGYQSAPVHMAVTVLRGSLDRVRVCLEIDDYTAMTDAIEEVLDDVLA